MEDIVFQMSLKYGRHGRQAILESGENIEAYYTLGMAHMRLYVYREGIRASHTYRPQASSSSRLCNPIRQRL